MSARITDRVFEPDDDASGQNEVAYLLKDLYAVAGLADERGWPVERYDYDAYGKVYMNRCAVLPWAADFDGDGDVDQNDLTVFLDAYGGSGEAPNGPCGWRADLDGDGDVDGSDYLLFADAYNGAGNPPRPPSPPVSVGSMAITSGSMVVGRVGNPFFFTGRRLDLFDKQDAGTPHHFTDDYAGLQLYDYRARAYDPVVGRFGQRLGSGLQPARNSYSLGGTGSPTELRDASDRDVVADRYGGVLYDLETVGSAKCNPKTGEVEISVTDTSCSASCTRKHEELHKGQTESCCRRVKSCVAKLGEKKCMEEYTRWIAASRDKLDCAAYLLDIVCYTKMLLTGRDDKGNALSKTCCQDLKDDIKSAYGLALQHCPWGGATPVAPCPFDQTGELVNPVGELPPWIAFSR